MNSRLECTTRRRIKGIRTDGGGRVSEGRQHTRCDTGDDELNVLVIAAHPDDELLGLGGAVASHCAKGDHVRLAIMCEGVSQRYAAEWDQEVRKQAKKAAQILGVTDLVLGNL